MQKHKRRKHKSHKRSLVVGNEHRPFFETTTGGKIALDTLGTSVDTEAASIKDQVNYRSQQQQATARADEARRILTRGLRHVSTVSTLLPGDSTPKFDGTRPMNDEQLIARVEAIIAGTSAPHTDAFVNGGVQPALLERLTSKLAAFKKAKETITLSGKLYTEATAALDRALAEGDAAIRVLDGILETSPDAPAGALTAFRQAKLIGPRDKADDAVAAPSPEPAPAPAVSPAPDVPNKVA